MTSLTASAPHIHDATTYDDLVDWGPQPDALAGASHSSGRLLHKGPGNIPEAGVWVCTPGKWRLSIPRDEFCYFLAGDALYESDSGETVEVRAGTAVHFPPGWSGVCAVRETLRNSYMLSSTDVRERSHAAVLADPLELEELVDWGAVPTNIEGNARTSGKLLARNADRSAETGVWLCTPGLWDCHVTSDEYCHFLAGHSIYTHESGETIEIRPDTLAFFPKDWRGTCRVVETVRKVYMIR